MSGARRAPPCSISTFVFYFSPLSLSPSACTPPPRLSLLFVFFVRAFIAPGFKGCIYSLARRSAAARPRCAASPCAPRAARKSCLKVLEGNRRRTARPCSSWRSDFRRGVLCSLYWKVRTFVPVSLLSLPAVAPLGVFSSALGFRTRREYCMQCARAVSRACSSPATDAQRFPCVCVVSCPSGRADTSSSRRQVGRPLAIDLSTVVVAQVEYNDAFTTAMDQNELEIGAKKTSRQYSANIRANIAPIFPRNAV